MRRTAISCFSFALIILTIAAASGSVSAIRIGGYEFGFDGIKKTAGQPDDAPRAESDYGGIVIETDKDWKVSGREIADGLREVNRNRRATDYLKSEFSGEGFCVETEERVAYLVVGDDGHLGLSTTEPRDCYRIRTTEQALRQSWDDYEAGVPMKYSDVRGRFDFPFKLRAKIAVSRVFG